ncbi:hypothetical protein [Hydrocarboniphaga sp.]|uniref:hypothetical protein n=1 Tax=Hydrocarboniphaga sp. TaxID=2033016 RepID=UPI003D0ED596
MKIRTDLQKLLRYNVDVLDQGLMVINAHTAAPACDFAAHSGPHLRHIIEHYEAFTQHIASSSVDYDTRARDRSVERDPKRASERIAAIQQQLAALDTDAIVEPIAVQMRGGIAGEDNFVSFSSLARELLFLASHAVHHYALIQVHCRSQGLSLGEDFGKAPATVRHARNA